MHGDNSVTAQQMIEGTSPMQLRKVFLIMPINRQKGQQRKTTENYADSTFL